MSQPVAFITIGQTPRDDILPELLPLLPADLAWQQFGVLDGMAEAEIADGSPRVGEERLVSRLRDGQEVVVGKRWLFERLERLLARLDGEGYRALVLLCTGDFPAIRTRTLLLEAQGILDNLTDALAEGRRVGLMVPLAEQCEEFAGKALRVSSLQVAHASPYHGDRLAQAADELSDCDLIVMHCLGYTEAMRADVSAATRRPVLLARRALASALAQVV